MENLSDYRIPLISPSPAACLLANLPYFRSTPRGSEESYISPYYSPYIVPYPQPYVSPYAFAPTFAPSSTPIDASIPTSVHRLRPQNVNHTIGARLQALAIAEFAFADNLKNAVKMASHYSGVSTKRIYSLRKQARQRGFDPETSSQLKIEYVQDAPGKGARIQLTLEVKKAIVEAIKRDRYGREKTCQQLAEPHGLSHTTVHRFLKNTGFRSCKPTMKPGLTPSMKEARLQFCLRHKHWTLEDWKNVIWTDETVVRCKVTRLMPSKVFRVTWYRIGISALVRTLGNT